jgi:hypothetical protein
MVLAATAPSPCDSAVISTEAIGSFEHRQHDGQDDAYSAKHGHRCIEGSDGLLLHLNVGGGRESYRIESQPYAKHRANDQTDKHKVDKPDDCSDHELLLSPVETEGSRRVFQDTFSA